MTAALTESVALGCLLGGGGGVWALLLPRGGQSSNLVWKNNVYTIIHSTLEATLVGETDTR